MDKIALVLSGGARGAHPIASAYFSKDIKHVREETFTFAEQVMHLVPVELER